MATFNGSSSNDIFTGGSDADAAYGNGGGDTLSGNGGNDTIVGGAGADSLSGGDGDDQLFSHTLFPNPGWGNGISYDIYAEPDTLTGGAGDDYIFAGYGDNVDGGTRGSFGDRLFISFQGATSGVDADFRPLQSGGSVTIGGATIQNIQNVSYLEGSNYDDTLIAIDTYYPSGSRVYGRGGNDYMVADYYSGWGSSGLWGGDGNDTIDATNAQYGAKIYGDAGDDLLRTSSQGGSVAWGGDGNDTIYAGSEAHGGAGNDVFVMTASYYGGGVYGDDGDDLITGDPSGGYYANSNFISGGNGADTMTGGGNSDTLASGNFATGTHTPADDMGLEHDVLKGYGGDDILAIGYGDDADGGDGNDRLSFSLGGATSGVTIDLTGITGAQPYVFAGGTIQNVETLDHLTGSAFGDTITAGTQASLLTIDAGGGDDKVIGGGSSVEFHGGSGNDTFVSGIAGDRFDGGDGFDTADYSQFASGISVTLGVTDGTEGVGPGGDALIHVEQILGTAFADTMSGSNQADALIGNDGNDSLAAGGGNDTLNGGSGNDTLDGGAGADQMTGGAGDDSFFVDNAGDQVFDTGVLGSGNDLVTASASWTLGAGQEIETIVAAAGAAINLTGNELANTITGNEKANALHGQGGNDTLTGGEGNDTLDGGSGDDQMAGGANNDVYYVDSAGDVVTESANAGVDTVIVSFDYTLGQNLENLTLLTGSGAQMGIGNAADNVITGNGLDNNLSGDAGNDTIDGGTGADTMTGGAGNDVFLVDQGGDRVVEGAGGGVDMVIASASWALGTGQEIETIAAAAGVSVDLTGNELGNIINANDTGNALHGLGGADTLQGGAGNDTLDGGDGSDQLNGGAGHDVIFGGDGADVLTGGGGNDHIYGQSAAGGADGADSISGGDGSDYLQGNAGNDTIDGGSGTDHIYGGADNDRITAGDGADIVNGNRGNDTIDGGTGNDFLRGGQDDDQINGGADNDTLNGDLGNDRLSGDAGDDLIEGGRGADTLTGGSGADLFRFDRFAGADANGNVSPPQIDEITDFTHGTDHISLEFTPAAILTGSAADAAAAITTAQGLMTAHAGFHEVALIHVGSDTYLIASGTGGSDAAEMAIRLDGVTAGSLSVTDFV